MRRPRRPPAVGSGGGGASRGCVWQLRKDTWPRRAEWGGVRGKPPPLGAASAAPPPGGSPVVAESGEASRTRGWAEGWAGEQVEGARERERGGGAARRDYLLEEPLAGW